MKRFKVLSLMSLIVLFGVMLPYITMHVMNADLYGRLTKSLVVFEKNDNASSEPTPILRFVMHKVIKDESSIEASIVLFTKEYGLADKIRSGELSFTARIRDGYLYQPYPLFHEVILDSATINDSNGITEVAIESERFLFPTSPSLNGFPFDDIMIYPSAELYCGKSHFGNFRFEVQKTLAGRIISISDKRNGIVKLTRTSTEVIFVLLSSMVFLFLSFMLSYGLIKSTNGLSRIEELVAVAGYLLATAGFRELLGVSRVAGISALEITVIGVPLCLLFFALMLSFIRGNTGKNNINKNGQ